MSPSQSKSAQLGLALTLLFSLPSHAGVWAHYPFDSNYDDTSGSARNGTLTDVGTIGNSGITTSSGSYKFGGGALNLHAERDYVAIPRRPSIPVPPTPTRSGPERRPETPLAHCSSTWSSANWTAPPTSFP